MVGDIGVHRADHGNVVDHAADVGKQFTDFDSALPMFVESERRGERCPGLALGREVRGGQGLLRVFIQGRLGVNV